MSTTMGMAVAAGFTIAAVTCGMGSSLRPAAGNAVGARPKASAVLQRGEHVAGGTVWRGQTTLPLGAGGSVTIDEEIVLDDDDALVRAFTHARGDDGETSTWYQPSSGLVTTEAASVTTHTRVPTDERWVYGPVRTAGGEPLGTPLAAWVTYRAAAHASHLRVVEPGGSDLVPVDQLVVTTPRGSVVILGDDAIDVDGAFVAGLHARVSGTRFVRIDPIGTQVHFARGT